LADKFQMMQDNFEYLCIDEYSLCQTTLEQVFNAFARQQVQNEIGDNEAAALASSPTSPPANGVSNVASKMKNSKSSCDCETQDTSNSRNDDNTPKIREDSSFAQPNAAQQPEPEDIPLHLDMPPPRLSSCSSDRGDPVFSASVDRQNAAELVEGLLRAAGGTSMTPECNRRGSQPRLLFTPEHVERNRQQAEEDGQEEEGAQQQQHTLRNSAHDDVSNARQQDHHHTQSNNNPPLSPSRMDDDTTQQEQEQDQDQDQQETQVEEGQEEQPDSVRRRFFRRSL